MTTSLKVWLFLSVVLACGCGARVLKVSEDVFFVEGKGGASNQLFVNTSHGPLVADARLNPLVTDDVLEQVRRTTRWEDAAYLVNTSALPHRWLTNYCFRKAEIVASEKTLETMMVEAPTFMKALEEREPKPPWADEINPVFPSLTFKGRLVLRPRDANVYLIEMPAGVVPGNTVVWLPKAGVLYAGDLVTKGVAPPLEFADLEKWFEALEIVERLPVKVLLPGFGGVADAALVEEQKRCVRALAERGEGVPSVCRLLWNQDLDLEGKIARLGSKREG